MKFGTLVRDIAKIMNLLNCENIDFDDVLFYYRTNDDKLHISTKMEVRYCDTIDRYAFILLEDTNK